MKRMLLVLTVVLAAGTASGSKSSPAAVSFWSRAVTRICAHALLFEGRHEIGTRAGAVAVARDIRASTSRRVRRIRQLEIAPPQPHLTTRWLSVEQRLAAVYASSYVRIYDAIDAARTPRQRARLPGILHSLLDAPNALRAATATLERRLQVPDCTGGGPPNPPGQIANP